MFYNLRKKTIFLSKTKNPEFTKGKYYQNISQDTFACKFSKCTSNLEIMNWLLAIRPWASYLIK